MKRGINNKMKNRIKERRKELGLTQVELAEKISISRQYISKLEVVEDSEAPSLKVANEIATALGTCIYAIFDLDSTGIYKCSSCNCSQ